MRARFLERLADDRGNRAESLSARSPSASCAGHFGGDVAERTPEHVPLRGLVAPRPARPWRRGGRPARAAARPPGTHRRKTHRPSPTVGRAPRASGRASTESSSRSCLCAPGRAADVVHTDIDVAPPVHQIRHRGNQPRLRVARPPHAFSPTRQPVNYCSSLRAWTPRFNRPWRCTCPVQP